LLVARFLSESGKAYQREQLLYVAYNVAATLTRRPGHLSDRTSRGLVLGSCFLRGVRTDQAERPDPAARVRALVGR
jgi:hypothetical protein